MPPTKTGATLPDGKRFSIKRQDMFRVGRIIESLIEEVPGGSAYKLGHSDETAASAVLEKLSLPITSEAVKKLRQTMFDPLVTDKGGMKGKI